MKRNKMLDVLGQIDDNFIQEASPENAKDILKELKREKRQKRKWLRYGLLATACSLLIALNLWLFIPFKVTPPSVAEFSSSPYYSVIQKLNIANFKTPKYKNNFQKLIRGGFFPFKATMDVEMPEMNEYVETTDNQVNGVIEADLIKRTTTHAFYLCQNTIRVYTIDKENSKLVTTYEILVDAEFIETNCEMFLSEDGKRLSVIIPYVTKGEYLRVLELVSLDVENLQNITEISRISLNTCYSTSRYVDGNLLIIGNYTVYRNVDFSKQEEFVPSITINGERTFIPIEDIISPDVLTNSNYTVVCKIDEQTLQVEDFTAFLSYSQAVYVSQDYVYVARTFEQEHVISKNKVHRTTMTEIIPISYKGDGLDIVKSVTVAGEINDQYSLDEYEGRLRIVTTTEESEEYTDGRYNSTKSVKTNANLYVVSLESMQIVANVRNFAPDGESVRSTRFDKNMVYVCTSIYVKDPVFFFDLTDLSNIKIKDTGTIAGFSTSLVNFGEGYLLGIGVGESGRDLKIEIYTEGETGVVSVCKYEAEVGYSQNNYKSYYINRQDGLVGLGVWDHLNGDTSYLLLHFNGEELSVVFDMPLESRNSYFARMILVDGYAYVFIENEFKIASI